MLSGAAFAGGAKCSVALAAIICFAPQQTSILAKVITPFESKTKSGQFVLQSPNGSMDSKDALIDWFS